MARRGGKAANRRTRQRSAQRPTPVRRPSPAPVVDEPAVPVPPVGTPDALEAISLDPPRRTSPPISATAGSSLTARERAEYHYVERDLRNIGVLMLIMTVLLVLAYFVFRALGIVG